MVQYAVPRSEAPVVPRVPATRVVSAASAIAVMALAVFGMMLGSQIKQANIDGYRAEGNSLFVQYGSPRNQCEMLRMRALETADAVILDMVDWAPIPGQPMLAYRLMCTTEFQLSEPLGDREVRLPDGTRVVENWESLEQ